METHGWNTSMEERKIKLLYTRKWEETQMMGYWEEGRNIQGKTSKRKRQNEPQKATKK